MEVYFVIDEIKVLTSLQGTSKWFFQRTLRIADSLARERGEEGEWGPGLGAGAGVCNYN